MSILRSLQSALTRSLDTMRQSTAAAMRMEVTPTSRTEGSLPIWAINHPSHLSLFAMGSDSDIGGLSQAKLGLDEQGKGRFFGTISNEVPRGGKIERSGYAAFRNKNRPTLFGQQTWDTTLYPYLSLRVRDRRATGAGQGSAAGLSSARLSEALSQSSPFPHASPQSKAIHALGLTDKTPGPKFFINIQTDGPVTSDLFQHRLWLDPALGSGWQTVLIPFDDFVLTNTGQVAPSQITMMREKLRTVGISVVVDTPLAPNNMREMLQKSPSAAAAVSSPTAASGQAAPAALRRRDDAPGAATSAEAKDGAALEDEDWASDGGLVKKGQEAESLRGAKRARRYDFDLGIEGVWAVGEEALSEVASSAPSSSTSSMESP